MSSRRVIVVGGGAAGFFAAVACAEASPGTEVVVLERGARFRASARGYALGSGNSIPDYVPVEGYLALVRAAQELRRREGTA